MNSRNKLLLIVFVVFVLLGALTSGALAAADTRSSILLPVWIEDQSSHDVMCLIDSATSGVWIDADTLKTELNPWVAPDALRGAEKSIETRDGKHWISLTRLRELGLRADFDESRLEIRLFIPAQLKKTNTVSVVRRDPPLVNEPPTHPSRVSAFVNANLGEDLLWSGTQETSKGRQPLRTELDAALNLDTWVIEGAASGTERASPVFTRGDFRLVKDQPSSMVRYSLGDVQTPATGFMRSRPVGGIAAVTNFNLRPYRITTPISTTEIFLKTRSTVKIWLNGRPVQTIQLPAGRHDIRDLPFSVGFNDVYLEITDDVGRVEIVRVPYIFSDQLLATGLHQLAYSIGFNSQPTNYGRQYFTNQPTLTLSHRTGLSDAFTFGGFVQADQNQLVTSLNSVWSTSLGTWTLEPAVSRTHGVSPGAGARLAYLYSDYLGPARTPRNLGLSFESRFARFAPLRENPVPDGSSQHLISLSLAQQLLWQTSAGLTGTFRLNRSQDHFLAPGRTLALTLSRTWATGIDTNLTLTSTRDPLTTGSQDQFNAFLLVSLAFPEKSQYVHLTGNSQDKSVRAEWTHNRLANTVGGYQAQANIARSDTATSADGRLEYSANRARLSAEHEITRATLTGETSQKTSLRAGAALVFTSDGGLALSRPVSDSFVMVAPERHLKKEKVLLNPREEDRFEARADQLGPGVYPDLVSYRYTQVNLTLQEATAGAYLPKENYILLPGYKSGSTLSIGDVETIFASGRIQDAQGTSQPLWSGELRSLTHPEAPVLVLFTNREGEFAVEGLKPGRYEARSFDPTRGMIQFEVSGTGAVSLGTLTLQAGENP